MDKIDHLVELLNTLLYSAIGNLVLVDKSSHIHVQDCLHDFKDTLEFVQLEFGFEKISQPMCLGFE